MAKRLGTALRKIVKDDSTARKIEKQKAKPSVKTNNTLTLCGKSFGGIKDSTINKLTTYYRNAIDNDIGSVSNMKIAIFATLKHCSSTDQKLQHGSCFVG